MTSSGAQTFPDIADRSQDDRKLRINEVFHGETRHPASSRGISFTLEGARSDSECPSAVWGQRLQAVLVEGHCNQVIRGLYADRGRALAGLIVIMNMGDYSAAQKVVDALDSSTKQGFVFPLASKSSDVGFGSGLSVANGESVGHYVFISWVQDRRTSGVPRDYLIHATSVLDSARDALIHRA
ncbi:hypothetical protein [Actinoallomurus sp. CA-150999]|uniref:hypothetical protein n=1 Tax=Actinoallomurus sp. CA-150999 TaxID=3239887 RepID=UPI003D8D03D3